MNAKELKLNAYYVPGSLLALEGLYANLRHGTLQFGGIYGYIHKPFQYNGASGFKK